MTYRQPWECPRCNRICAPHLDYCDCQPGQPAAVPSVWPFEPWTPLPGPIIPSPPATPTYPPGGTPPGTTTITWVLT